MRGIRPADSGPWRKKKPASRLLTLVEGSSFGGLPKDELIQGDKAMASEPIHPLFDPRSFYRLASRHSTWEDGGDTSVRSYFVARAREELHRRWLEDTPGEVQPWGHGDELDGALHSFLLRSRKESLQRRGVGAAREREMPWVGEPPGEAAPALLVFGMSQAGEAPVPQRSPHLFTGAGQGPRDAIATFRLDVSNLTAGRRVVAIIIDFDLLGRLALLLRWGEPRDEPSAIRLIQTTLLAETLSGQQDDEACRLAFRISTTLARAPALEGLTDRAGQFTAQVELGRGCPGLDCWTWLIVYVGPPA